MKPSGFFDQNGSKPQTEGRSSTCWLAIQKIQWVSVGAILKRGWNCCWNAGSQEASRRPATSENWDFVNVKRPHILLSFNDRNSLLNWKASLLPTWPHYSNWGQMSSHTRKPASSWHNASLSDTFLLTKCFDSQLRLRICACNCNGKCSLSTKSWGNKFVTEFMNRRTKGGAGRCAL